MTRHSDTCACCSGIRITTPRGIENAPGQPAISYRIGRHGSFRDSMLARLSSAAVPALARLRTREDSDFTLALADAAATMLDVMTFYQERLANEHYLRTATERRSVRELAALVGFQPSPGVAANVYLAFTLDEAPGDPSQAAAPIVLPLGTRVQSVPGPNEQAQTFETVVEVETRPAWNAIPAWSEVSLTVGRGATEAWLGGIANQLSPGDMVLFVDTNAGEDLGKRVFDLRVLTEVASDSTRNVTRVAWGTPLVQVSDPSTLASHGTQMFVMRQRAAQFGHNAPNANLLSTVGSNIKALMTIAAVRTWNGLSAPTSVIDMDTVYPRVAPASWMALMNSTLAFEQLYRVSSVSELARDAFGMSARVTRVTPDSTTNLDKFTPRETAIFGQSELLTTATRPLDYPLYGMAVELSRIERDLTPGRVIAVRGKPPRVEVRRGGTPLKFKTEEGKSRALEWGDQLQVIAAPEEVATDGTRSSIVPSSLPAKMQSATVAWRLRDRDGQSGKLVAPAGTLQLRPSLKADLEIMETAVVDDAPTAVLHDRERTTLSLEAALDFVYERATTTINANVVSATHGESTGEILGNGDASRPDQRFALKQAPLTYVSVENEVGRESTLEVRVGGIAWQEQPTLFEAAPTDRVYTIQSDDEGRALVAFGDGVEGARLPTGIANVRASYRKGIGAAGNVDAGKIKTLLSRPLGVMGVINPEPAAGGQDAQTRDQARSLAPLSVMTLGRVVSIQDYTDFSRNFSGITKAHAVRMPAGPARGMFVTVAGPEGKAVPADGKTMKDLVGSLRTLGDSSMPLRVRSYRQGRFRVHAAVKVNAAAIAADVLDEVKAALAARFGFDAREFGMPVTQDEIIAAIHSVASVDAVALRAFHRATEPETLETILWPEMPAAQLAGEPQPAELLTLDLAGSTLGILT